MPGKTQKLIIEYLSSFVNAIIKSGTTNTSQSLMLCLPVYIVGDHVCKYILPKIHPNNQTTLNILPV